MYIFKNNKKKLKTKFIKKYRLINLPDDVQDDNI